MLFLQALRLQTLLLPVDEFMAAGTDDVDSASAWLGWVGVGKMGWQP